MGAPEFRSWDRLEVVVGGRCDLPALLVTVLVVGQCSGGVLLPCVCAFGRFWRERRCGRKDEEEDGERSREKGSFRRDADRLHV